MTQARGKRLPCSLFRVLGALIMWISDLTERLLVPVPVLPLLRVKMHHSYALKSRRMLEAVPEGYVLALRCGKVWILPLHLTC